MSSLFNRFISFAEKKKISIAGILFSVFVIASLRTIFELLYKFGYIYGKPNIISQYIALNNFFFHFTSFWVTVFLTLAIVLYLFTFRVNSLLNTLKIGMFGMFIIIFPVLFDLIISNTDMMLYPNDPRDFFYNIKHYFNIKHKIFGISPGMRYEVFFASIFSGIYVYSKNKKILLASLASLSTFFIIIFFGLWVSFFGQMYENGFSFDEKFLFTTSSLFSTSIIMKHWIMSASLVYTLIVLSALTFIFRNAYKKEFFTVIKNFRLNRVFHYLLLFFAGLAFAKIIYLQHNNLIDNFKLTEIFNFKNPFDYLGIIGGAVSIFLSFQASVIFNDYYDLSVDKISNKNRPLTARLFSKKQYFSLGLFFVFFALYMAYIINVALFFFMLASNFLAYVYSNEPFRLRKYFIINNLIIGLIALAVFHGGTTLLLNDRSFTKIPEIVSYAIVLGYAIGSIIKDKKDYLGDKKNNIQTIFTVFGQKTGQVIFAALVSAAILFLPMLLEVKLSIFISILFILIFNAVLFLIKKNEKYIFLFYYLFVTIIFMLYFFTLIKQ